MDNLTQNSTLKIQHLSSGYGKKQVLFDVSFEVKQGEIVLLAGSNGSGKSTLLKAIFGLVPLWSGSVTFGGETIHSTQNPKLNTQNSTFTTPPSKLLNRGLLYIPQKNNLFEDLTVKENLEMAGLTLPQYIFKNRLAESLGLFPVLKNLLGQKPIIMSGGERQMLTLAMATLHKPKMILLDEPFSGLSPQNITFVVENLRVLNQKSGISLLIVEHRVKECIRIAIRVIGLKLGRVLGEAEVNEKFDINQLNFVFI